MRLPGFTYYKPSTPAKVCSLLSKYQGEARPLAGGTALLVDLGQRLVTPKYIISLSGLRMLDYIKEDEKGWLRIGACTTIDSLCNSALVKAKYPVLVQAAGLIGVPSIRLRGTVGGNISLDTRCIYYNQSEFWWQSRIACFKRAGNICHAVKGSKRCNSVCQSDLAPVLLALDARVKLQSGRGERNISISGFFTGQGEKPNILSSEQIITEIQIPPLSKNSVGAYHKRTIRRAIDFPLASVAAVLDINRDKVCHNIKLVLGAIAPAPVEINMAETILKGKSLNDELIEEAAEAAFKAAHPVGNLSIDAGYRRKMIRIFTKRAIKQALNQGYS